MCVCEGRCRRWGAWVGAALLFVTCVGVLQAEDWPEWRGKGRLGIWNERIDSISGGRG